LKLAKLQKAAKSLIGEVFVFATNFDLLGSGMIPNVSSPELPLPDFSGELKSCIPLLVWLIRVLVIISSRCFKWVVLLQALAVVKDPNSIADRKTTHP
jgi:hypothetical protein